MLTSGKLLSLAAEIQPQTKADPGARAAPLELVRAAVPEKGPVFETVSLDHYSPMAPVVIPRPTSPVGQRPSGGAVDLLSLRVDPSQVRRAVASPETPIHRPVVAEADIAAIDDSFSKPPDQKNRFSRLRTIATQEDMEEAKRLARLINPRDWAEIFVRFSDELVEASYRRDQRWRLRDGGLSRDWAREPWYIADPRWFFTADSAATSTFADVERGLDWVRQLGFDNVALLPHYEVDGLDTGASITELVPARVLGGSSAFEHLFQHGQELGMRIATSAPFGQTSIHHKWFERALEGDAEALGYYRRASASSGALVAEIGGREIAFAPGRRAFQAALDLGDPHLLGELFRLLGREANQGSIGRLALGCQTWPHDHSVLALAKLFLTLLAPRQILIPEVTAEAESAAKYAGKTTDINRVQTSTEGDVFLWFDASRALRESLLLEDRLPVESVIDELPQLPKTVVPAVLLEHPALGPRNSTLHDGDAQRIALSMCCLYMLPATPILYAGSEIGAEDNLAHAELSASRQEQYLASLGAPKPVGLAEDPALRHEGALFARDFVRHAQDRYLPLETLRALNLLRRKHPALMSREITRLDNGHKGVFSWIKHPEQEGDQPLFLIANLSKHTARLAMNAADLRPALRLARDRAFQLSDVWTPLLGRPRPPVHRIAQHKLFVTLPPSGFIALSP